MNEQINEMMEDAIIATLEEFGKTKPGSEESQRVLKDLETLYTMKTEADHKKLELDDNARNAEAEIEIKRKELEIEEAKAIASKKADRKKNVISIFEIIFGVGAKVLIETAVAKANYNMFVDLTNFEKDGNMALSRSFKEFMKNGIRVFRAKD